MTPDIGNWRVIVHRPPVCYHRQGNPQRKANHPMTFKCPCFTSTPPIPPSSALLMIPAVGKHNQFHADGWNYFMDNQEEELTAIDGPGDATLLSAVCSCGGGLYEVNHEFRWQVAANHICQGGDK